jgi:DNA-binding HxlR family transcriptional regulator
MTSGQNFKHDADFERSPCPIASSLDLLGDKWTLVLVRDLVTGKRRYGEFLDSPEGIATNILAARLKEMTDAGLIDKHPYQRNPLRHDYVLTARGRDLLPVLQAFCRWGNRHFPGSWVPPESFMKPRSR